VLLSARPSARRRTAGPTATVTPADQNRPLLHHDIHATDQNARRTHYRPNWAAR
jgi:hypothetical protein